jgi:hypothetical protein
MSSWSKNRKLAYGGIVLAVIAVALVVPGFFLVYEAPTCSDGMMNGKEEGIDCGGSCIRLCQSSFSTPSAAWTRFEPVAPRLYNIAAYILNPNTDGEAFDVPYRMSLYDNRGVLILQYDDEVTLPPHRNTLAFRGAVDLGERIPAKAIFEFIRAPDWHSRTDPLGQLQILDKKYAEEENSSSLLVTIKNNSVLPVGPVSVYAVLYDSSGNAIGFSKTILDRLAAQETATAPFTWPKTRGGQVVSVEVLPALE